MAEVLRALAFAGSIAFLFAVMTCLGLFIRSTMPPLSDTDRACAAADAELDRRRDEAEAVRRRLGNGLGV